MRYTDGSWTGLYEGAKGLNTLRSYNGETVPTPYSYTKPNIKIHKEPCKYFEADKYSRYAWCCFKKQDRIIEKSKCETCHRWHQK